MTSENFEIQSDVEALSKTIIDVINISRKNNLHIWLNYGALLGMIRENRLLPWNNDAHLNCKYEKDFEYKCIQIVNDLERIGYRAYYYPTNGSINIKKTKTGVDVNINCVWAENNKYVRPHEEAAQFKKKHVISYILYWLSRSMSIYTSNINFKKLKTANTREKIKIMLIIKNMIITKKIRKFLYKQLLNLSKYGPVYYQKTAIPISFYKEFIDIDFYGSKISVPKKNKELLEYIYGNTWKTPINNWSFYDKKNKYTSNMKYIDESWDYKNVDFI